MTKWKIWIPMFLLIAVVAVGFKNTDNVWKIGDGITGNIKTLFFGPDGILKWDSTKMQFSDDAGVRFEDVSKAYSVIINNNGANCLIKSSTEINDWITSVVRNGTGDCTINTSLTASPQWNCQCTASNTGNLCSLGTGATTVQFLTFTEGAAIFAAADLSETHVSCARK